MVRDKSEMNTSENKAQEVIKRIKKNKKQHRKIRLYMMILSCVVFLLVFWQLRGTGIALLRDVNTVATATDAEKNERSNESEELRESGTVTVERAEISSENAGLNTEEKIGDETEEASEENPDEYPEKIEYEAESESGIRVRINVTPDAFPEGTDIKVEDVPEEEAMEIAEAGVAEIKGTDTAPIGDEAADGEDPEVSTAGDAEALCHESSEQEVEIHSAVGVDITFISPEGEEIEPKEGSSVDVSILLPEEAKIENENLCLLHQVDEETIEHIEDAKVEDEEVVFTTESFSIYVMTKIGLKDKDEVHETLRDRGYFFVPWGNNDAAYYPNHNDYPYIIMLGDSFSLVGVGSANSMSLIDYDDWWGTIHYLNSSDRLALVNSTDEILDNGQHQVTCEFKANQTGRVEISYGDEKFYVDIRQNVDRLTHADIEVADGGYYNVTDVRYEDGKKITTIKSYMTFVTQVNESRVFNSNNQQITYMDDGTPRPYVSTDYEQQGSPGDTQYELTAAWKGVANQTPKFDFQDAMHVEFDVNLEFLPKTERVIVEQSGNVISDQTTNIEGNSNYSSFTLNNVMFDMDRTSIVDAYNKCPNHTGLDFNIKYTRASVVLTATKKFVGGTLSAGQFTFETVDDQGNNSVVGVAHNDADGNIIFPRIEYDTSGQYKYKIRENTGNDDAYIYDDSEYEVTVTVEYNSNGDLEITSIEYAGGTDPEFTNYVKYTLPSTGGIGIYPYVILGILLCGASLLLLILTRRRGSG